MFQCLGLGTHETGGCGEDWYHPGCIVGMGPNWFEKTEKKNKAPADAPVNGTLPVIVEETETTPQNGDAAVVPEAEDGDDDDPAPPPGFPAEDDFDTFICYKCVEAHPWIKQYAGQPGFLPPVFLQPKTSIEQSPPETNGTEPATKKRKADDEDTGDSLESKRFKSEVESTASTQQAGETATTVKDEAVADVATESKPACKLDTFPPAPEGKFSLFCPESFRESLCRCSKCFPNLTANPQLLEEEDIYEPPVSENGSNAGGSTNGSGSLLDRGESALRNVDRVRAIEGVMAYNNLKDKLKPFFQKFAESGEAIGAEDIKEYFAKLRGDNEAIKEAGESAKSDNRKEQSGY